MNKLFIITVLAVAVLGYSAVNAQIDPSTLGQPFSTVENPYTTVSSVGDTASTTSELLTALADRREVEVRVNEASKDLWLAVGASTATVSGANCVLVTSTSPYKAKLDDSVAIAAIASEAFSFTLIQYK